MQIKKRKIKPGRGVGRRGGALRTIRNVAISVGVLLVLLVGAALLFVWLGQAGVQPQAAEDPQAKAQLQSEDPTRRLDPEAPVGVSVQSISSPVEPGNNVLIIAQTRPEATCTITVEYDDVEATDSGLHEKTADVYGSIQWTWAVPANTPEGAWPVTIYCTYNEKSGMVIKDLVVKSE